MRAHLLDHTLSLRQSLGRIIALIVLILQLNLMSSLSSLADSTIEREYDVIFSRPHDYQVGDIRLRIPPGQRVYVTGSRDPVDEYSSRLEVVQSVTIFGKDAWVMSGIPRSAPDWPPTLLRITLSLDPEAGIFDSWCHGHLGRNKKAGRDFKLTEKSEDGQGFHIFGENDFRGAIGVRLPIKDLKLFNSPLAFETSATISDPDQSSSDSYRLYSLRIAVTSNVFLYLRFSDADLNRTTADHFLVSIQQSLIEWASSTSNLEDLLYHRPNSPCPGN